MKKLSFQKQPIAHEVVFPSYIDKNFNTCVKFVTQSYLYFKELKASDFANILNKDHFAIYREFTVNKRCNNKINKELLNIFCNYFNLNIDSIYNIADEFLKTNHNVIILNEDLTSVKFLYGYKESFSEAA